MSAAIIILDDALTQRKKELLGLQVNIVNTSNLLEDIKQSKIDIETSIKDIELALAVLRKINGQA